MDWVIVLMCVAGFAAVVAIIGFAIVWSIDFGMIQAARIVDSFRDVGPVDMCRDMRQSILSCVRFKNAEVKRLLEQYGDGSGVQIKTIGRGKRR